MLLLLSSLPLHTPKHHNYRHLYKLTNLNILSPALPVTQSSSCKTTLPYSSSHIQTPIILPQYLALNNFSYSSSSQHTLLTLFTFSPVHPLPVCISYFLCCFNLALQLLQTFTLPPEHSIGFFNLFPQSNFEILKSKLLSLLLHCFTLEQNVGIPQAHHLVQFQEEQTVFTPHLSPTWPPIH